MHLPLVLLAALPALTQPGSPDDLSFRAGRLDAWQGHGFQITTAFACGPSRCFGVTSADRDRQGGKALLYQTFVVPSGVAAVTFTAAAVRPAGCEPGPALDVILEAAEREYVPRRVRTADGLRPAPRLLPPENGRPHEYVWDVASHAGELVRIALIDDDDRPGCHVFCSGFQLIGADDYNGREFADDMRRLGREHGLPPMKRRDSEHFLTIGDVEDETLQSRLSDCETLYALFFGHFKAKGFRVRPPAGRMMVAAFDSQEGFEAYLGRRMPSAITGLYDRDSNRLVVYDYARNRAFLEAKARGEATARTYPPSVQRDLALGAFRRAIHEWRDDTDIGTAMHEAAHQLSFNGGLLERDGDVPAWLAEGLACYCESTANGGWQGVGRPNPMRTAALATQVRGNGPLLSLRDLVASDDWLRTSGVGLGYAQSWALFRLLMEERSGDLRRYLDVIRARRTPDRRLDDFVEAFGRFSKMDARYQAYVREIVATEAPRAK